MIRHLTILIPQGHLVSAAGHKFSDWASAHGVENARAMARFSLMNVDRVQDLIGKHANPAVAARSEIRAVEKMCAVTDPDLWRHHAASVEMMAREVPERSGHNRLVDAAELRDDWGLLGVVGGYAQRAGALWPYRMCTEVFADLVRRYPHRLAIETHTPATSVDLDLDGGDDPSTNDNNKHQSRRYTVTTPRGAIRAGRVVYCTNGYTGHLLPRLRGKIHPCRGHMTTQAVPPQFPSDGGRRSWSLMQPERLDRATGAYHFGLYYLQQNAVTRDLFVGVENQTLDEFLSSDDSFVSEASRDDLPSFLPRMFKAVSGDDDEKPTLKAIWSGVMGLTVDGLPLVGRLPSSATGREAGEEWIAAGFQGYGMDKCWLTGEALVAMMAGKDVSDWFPSAYLITEERVAKRLDPEEAVKEYVQIAQ